MSERPIEAAGAVVWRSKAARLDVLLIHRQRYDDWTLPKGKLDPGEHALAAAVREVHEETGVAVRVGPWLARHEYTTTRPPGRIKQVTYWCAVPRDGTGRGADDYLANDEVDAVRWVGSDEAGAMLSYPRDAAVLERFHALVAARAHRTAPLLLLRHAQAMARATWEGADRERPLAETGREQAARLAPLLEAYGVDSVVSSHTVRCVQTLEPYATAAGVPVRTDSRWSEQAATWRDVLAGTRELLDGQQPTVLCTHRPVLPWVFEGLGLPWRPLDPGDALVVHRRRGDVVGTELVRPWSA